MTGDSRLGEHWTDAVEYNNGVISGDSYQLADLFDAVANRVPERLALVAGEHRLTFAELQQRAWRFGNHLRDQGVGPGTAIGIYARNRAEWVEAMLGAYAVRAVPININYRYTGAELAYVLNDADVELLVIERTFLPVLAHVRAELPKLRVLCVLDDETDAHDLPNPTDGIPYEVALRATSAMPFTDGRSNDDRYVLYTGGTTGMPKGVIWRHEDIFFAALGGNGFGAGAVNSPSDVVDRIADEQARMVTLIIAPMMHGAAQWVTCITLFGGGEVVLSTANHFDPHEIWTLVESERCNYVTLVGDAMARPLAEALGDGTLTHDTSSVAAIGSGGAIFSAAVKEQLLVLLPGVAIVDSFGASETGAGASQLDPSAGPSFPVNEWTAVLDDELRPVAPGSGIVGRLARRGHIPIGYHKDEAKTASTFRTDAEGVRWAVPGDHATIDDDGMITLLGRGSNCINSGGEKIYPEEVEAALKRHADVFDAVVLGVPDDRFTERVAAIVQPRPGRAPTIEELQSHCHQLIAGYKAPREVLLVDAIARLATGKADYRWARDQFSTPADDLVAGPAL